MTRTAHEVLESAVRQQAPEEGANRLVPLLATGGASREVIAALALEQHHVIAGDRRSFLHLAERTAGEPAGEFFAELVRGEDLALDRLAVLTTACGLDEVAVRVYEPLAGCQAYPAYTAWLALQGDPVDVVIALTANFAAWGGYCAAVSQSLRRHYGFDDEACGFFDFFAEPAPRLDGLGLAAVRDGLDRGRITEAAVRRYGRLLRSYESMFWNTLADRAA